MTAAGLDYVSGGRFTLGLGASGPQVIEGWHGVPYDAPIGRTREIIEICRAVWRRERLEYARQALHDPAAARAGHRAGQAAQADQPPGPGPDPDRGRRARPEERGAWPPSWPRAGSRSSTSRRRPRHVWGAPLAAGRAKRDPSLPPAGRDRPGAAGDRRRRRRVPGPRPAGRWPCTSAGWARRARAATSTTSWRCGYGYRGRGGRDPGRLPGRAARTRPRRWCPAELLEGTSLIGPRSHGGRAAWPRCGSRA